jgi:ABC-type multidrug transport system ATPase subunit
MEKEKKLVENMKTNGLNMYNYWLVNGIYNYISYTVTVFIYWGTGRYIFGLDFFKDTNVLLFIELFFVWGLCQISLSMFYCSLFSSAQAASMSAYTISIWTCTLVSNVTMAVFSVPRRLPMILMYYPTAPYVRATYLLLDVCTWDVCFGDYGLAPDEFHEMCWYLFLNSVVYMILALYLNQVIP